MTSNLKRKSQVWFSDGLTWQRAVAGNKRVSQLIGKDDADLGKKTLMLGKTEGRRRRIRWLDGIINTTAGIWANSGRQWRTGKPGVLQFMGSRRVAHNLATEQQEESWNSHLISTNLFLESWFDFYMKGRKRVKIKTKWDNKIYYPAWVHSTQNMFPEYLAGHEEDSKLHPYASAGPPAYLPQQLFLTQGLQVKTTPIQLPLYAGQHHRRIMPWLPSSLQQSPTLHGNLPRTWRESMKHLLLEHEVASSQIQSNLNNYVSMTLLVKTVIDTMQADVTVKNFECYDPTACIKQLHLNCINSVPSSIVWKWQILHPTKESR